METLTLKSIEIQIQRNSKFRALISEFIIEVNLQFCPINLLITFSNCIKVFLIRHKSTKIS